jgi:hypothetical protein
MSGGLKRRLANRKKPVSLDAMGEAADAKASKRDSTKRDDRPVRRNSECEAACQIFLGNLKELLRRDGRTMAEISELIGAPRQEWLRRIASKGLARRTRDNEQRLKLLAEVLKVKADDFWRPDLFVLLENPLIDLQAEDRERSLYWRKHELYPVIEKLEYLLATRRFDFLRDLIASSYEAEIKINPRRSPEAKVKACKRCHQEFEETKLDRFGLCSSCGA